MDASLWIARNLAAAWLAEEWTRASLVAQAQNVLGPAARAAQRLLVRDLLAAAPASYPPSQDWLVTYLLASARFREASGRIAQKLGPLQPILKPARFAPADRFAGLRIPRLATPGDLAKWLHISVEHLDWFADTRHVHRKTAIPIFQHYNYKFIPKRQGSPRLLEEPKPRLKGIQRQILLEILNLAPVHPCAHGFVRKSSCLSAAQVHAGEPIVAALDLRDFFLRTKVSRVHSVFRSLGYPSPVAFLLTGLCTTSTPKSVFARSNAEHDHETRALYETLHLPQGAPTSPALTNLTTWQMDCRLWGLARAFEANYARYADDLTFSGDCSFAARLDRFLLGVKTIVEDEGFALNPQKTRIMRRAGSQRVLGLTVNSHLNVPRKAYNELKAILHNCRRNGPESENRANLPRFRAHLDGRINWVENVNPLRGAKLRRVFDEIKWQPAECQD
jgi:hypothetical protein